MLRLPEGMRDRIAAAASQNNRSMNAEIISTLEQHYPSLASIDELISQTNELARIIRDTKERYDLMSLNSALRAIILELLKDAGKAGNPAYAPFAYAQPEEDDATD
jgi:hypothetical protein